MAESDSSETNLVIITRKTRLKQFCRLYWRTIIVFIAPIILLPVIFIKETVAYKCCYVFMTMIVYWTADVLHPSILALLPIATSSLMSSSNKSIIRDVCVRNDVIDCIGVMILVVAVEHSNIHRRIAIKILLLFGYSHYRLSFILFFTTMCLSMWFSDILACGIMMPIIKSILTELEKLGILEIYQTIGKARQMSNRYEQNLPRPSEHTIFYFLGIAYSSSIGNITTMISHTNQIFKDYCEIIFPTGPKIELPHFILLNLPAVLIMETLLYVWMNFIFLGILRHHNTVTIEIGMTDEEALYMDTLLKTQYQHLGNITFHEHIIAITVMLSALLQATVSTTNIEHLSSRPFHDHLWVSSPCLFSVIVLFIMPRKMDVLRFFKRRTEGNDPLPVSQTKSCLNWDLVKREVNWSVPFILVGSSCLFESLRDSEMTTEFEEFLLNFSGWPQLATIFVIVIFCKILTEFAPNISVAYVLLPSIAKISVLCAINPHYLMTAATLSCSLSFHLMAGSPVNAMVCAYVQIPPWRMMYAGIGPLVISIIVVWFTVAVWSTAIWTDIKVYPDWADNNLFKITNKHGLL